MRYASRKQPTFWTNVGLLLGAAWKRSKGRQTRQKQLLQSRSGGSGTNWGGLGFLFLVLVMCGINVGAAYVVQIAVQAGQRAGIEKQGKVVVTQTFRDFAKDAERNAEETKRNLDEFLDDYAYSAEAERLQERYGGNKSAIAKKLRDVIHAHGTRDLVTRSEASPGLTALAQSSPLSEMLGSLVLLWWAVMLIFQGEGVELDLQRRRHPMWEWIFSHPVPPGAAFFSEMLTPIAANPIYWGGLLFVGFLYGFVYDLNLGILAAFVIGIPVIVATACVGKSLEIGVLLRCSARRRGAVMGLMGWLGYASMMLFFLAILLIPKIVNAALAPLEFLARLPWPSLRMFLGGAPDGNFSFVRGVVTCDLAAGIAIAGSVWFSVWGTQQGLSGNFSSADTGPTRTKGGKAAFGREPLYRKEFLWFIRDRSAIVQTILIPLTVASYQAFNLRGILGHAQDAWNYLCGAAILFGTYFLWVLGPKSLSSEGTALWIALTWPRGLESLLKAKAWLWSLIATGLVVLVLSYAVFLYPESWYKVLLVGVGWFVFSRSMAEKTVTLVTVTSSSGEPEKIPAGRRWAAQLGMLTFSIGVLTQRWQLAVVGIVYSYLTAAATWQNFRARLPYLYDPWSEKVPPPPTLMHAMIAISIMVELMAVLSGILFPFMGPESRAVVMAMSYGISAVVVAFGVSHFLSGRGVTSQEVWNWKPTPGDQAQTWQVNLFKEWGIVRMFLLGAMGGLALALLAKGYTAVLWHIPSTAELLRKAQEAMAKIPDLKLFYMVMAVGFAPFAEEYLFRGLLYRALDREWGGWHAVVGSAAFFAIYHPPLSWLPVTLLGIANALLFKKTGKLAPAVLLHMVYNAVVLN